MKLIKSSKKINKLLVTGFNSNDNKSTVKFLEAYGISPATTSKNQNLTALELTKIIIDSMDGMEEGEEVSPIWHNLALDFVLGNLEYKNWYFENEDSLYLLDFWRKIDRQMTFILIYNSPENILYQHFLKQGANASESIDSLLSKWIEYNQKLLDFFYRNQDKSILINSMAVEENHLLLLERATSKIGLKFKSKKRKRAKKYDLIKTEVEKDPIVEHLANKIILENPKISELYAEMQSVANIFKKSENENKSELSSVNLLHHYMISKSSANTIIKEEKQKKEKLNIALENLKKKVEDVEKVKKDKEQENELLLTQLHSVQEELEKYYLENKGLKEKKRYYGAAERVKSGLSYRLGMEIAEKSKSLSGLITLPFALRAVKKEYELEKLKQEETLPPIESYADAYDAQRVKKHLTYELGQTTIEMMGKPFGLLRLPFALLSTRKKWRQSRAS